MSKPKVRRSIVALLCMMMAAAMLVMSFTGCSPEEADEWLNTLFGEGSYQTIGDQLEGEAVLKMHVIDVGQGDSTLIQCGEKNILIDCGENGMGDTVLDYLKKAGVTHLDWLIGTHPHSDHIGGMDTVIQSDIKIDKVMMPQTSEAMTPTTKTYTDVLEAISAKKLKITRPAPGKTYDLDGVTMLILSPKKNAEYSDLNDYSIVLKFTYGDISILTGGDATKKVEKELLASKYDLSAQIYKVFHHGSRESNSEAFIEAVQPTYCAISVGKDNSYGHPTEETLSRLASVNGQVNRTDLDGDLLYETDGKNISVTLSK